jgi:hypothetical protein
MHTFVSSRSVARNSQPSGPLPIPGFLAAPLRRFPRLSALFASAALSGIATLAVAGVAGHRATTAADRGLSAHYNRIIMAQLLFLVGAVWVAARCAGRWIRGWRAWLALGALMLLASVWSVASARAGYMRGLHGVAGFESVHGGCEVDAVTVPWFALLPRRTMNFWTGSYSCPDAGADGRWAWVERAPAEQGGAVTVRIDCAHAGRIVINPDWGSWRLPIQLIEMRLLYERHRPPVEIPYTGQPIPWPVGNEFVVAACGEERRLTLKAVVRIDTEFRRAKREVLSRALAGAGTGSSLTTPIADNDPRLVPLNNLGGAKTLAPSPIDQATLPIGSHFLLIDCISRAHFLRRMKRTAAWLEDVSSPRWKPASVAGAPPPQKGNGRDSSSSGSSGTGQGAGTARRYRVFQFFKYNVVGKNTFPNMTPIVTGRTARDPNNPPVSDARRMERLFYWRKPYSPQAMSPAVTDPVGDISSPASPAGGSRSRTSAPASVSSSSSPASSSLSSSSSSSSSPSSPSSAGGPRRAPAAGVGGYVSQYVIDLCQDYFGYYWNTTRSHLTHEAAYAYCDPAYEPLQRSNFVGPYSLGRRCLAPGVPVAEDVLTLGRQFQDAYDGVGRVSLLKFMEAHEGSMEVVATLDEPLTDHLVWMDARGYLGAGITVLASDHGNHMSPYALFTEAGRTERKLGTLFVIVPESIAVRAEDRMEAMYKNQFRLVTGMCLLCFREFYFSEIVFFFFFFFFCIDPWLTNLIGIRSVPAHTITCRMYIFNIPLPGDLL